MTSLKQTIQRAFERALGEGSLIWIQTARLETIVDRGIPFQIRFVPSLAKKPTLDDNKKDHAVKKKPFNPFLPPEPKLFVQKIGAEHNLVLNKFCLARDHFILSTTRFIIQNTLLDKADLSAIWTCLKDWPELLVFHNCGSVSGASQPHKHVQAIPAEDNIPIDKVVKENGRGKAIGEPFTVKEYAELAHAVALLPDLSENPEMAVQTLEDIYLKVLDAAFKPLAMSHAFYASVNPEAEQMDPTVPSHNLLMTRDWIFCIPRKAESFEGVGANSVGFAGWMLATDEEQLRTLERGVGRVLDGLGYRL